MMTPSAPSAIAHLAVTRVDGGGASTTVEDCVACEAALEVRLDAEPFAVIMRTPGADRDLVAGFLFTERVIDSAADLAGIELDGDVANVRLAGDAVARAAALGGSRRQVAMNASCGLCGRRSLESIDVPGAPLAARWRVPADIVAGLPEALRAAQPLFTDTGGLHASALVDLDGRLLAAAEDVGRHNAVDKLIGRMLLAGRLPLSDLMLAVSGRSSFEIVQKAWLAGIPLIAAVSAPSSLAVRLARDAGLTLLGFVRGDRFNIYAHGERVGPRREAQGSVSLAGT